MPTSVLQKAHSIFFFSQSKHKHKKVNNWYNWYQQITTDEQRACFILDLQAEANKNIQKYQYVLLSYISAAKDRKMQKYISTYWYIIQNSI